MIWYSDNRTGRTVCDDGSVITYTSGDCPASEPEEAPVLVTDEDLEKNSKAMLFDIAVRIAQLKRADVDQRKRIAINRPWRLQQGRNQ